MVYQCPMNSYLKQLNLEKEKKGNKKTNYRLKDWGIL